MAFFKEPGLVHLSHASDGEREGAGSGRRVAPPPFLLLVGVLPVEEQPARQLAVPVPSCAAQQTLPLIRCLLFLRLL